MNKIVLIIKNSLIGIISQLLLIIFSFITRNLFIKYIGVELLGINSTFSSVLGALSLAEMGVQTAITYSLYTPLINKDIDAINKIINLFKYVYRIIGLLFIFGSIIILPFLKYILTDVTVDGKIYLYFILQAAASASSYFLSYKRTLLYADKRDYISKCIDLIIGIIFNALLCILLVVYKNYIYYLTIKIVQVVVGNAFVHIYCSHKYKWLKSVRADKEIFKILVKDIKNVFIGKVAGYIYNSTDNIVVSALVNTMSVGYLVNYTTITGSVKTLIKSMLNPLIPFIGTYLSKGDERHNEYDKFSLYTFVRLLVAFVTIVPMYALINDFISLWVGSSMVLDEIISTLILIELYMDILNSAAADFIIAGGLFKQEKNICLIGAMVNIVSSVIFVKMWGMQGVWLGTILSQVLFWVLRSYVVIFSCFELDWSSYKKYWTHNLLYIISIIFTCAFAKKMYQHIIIDNAIAKFIVGGVVSEVLCIMVILLMCLGMPEGVKLLEILKKLKQEHPRNS